jgi:hypothetical protein
MVVTKRGIHLKSILPARKEHCSGLLIAFESIHRTLGLFRIGRTSKAMPSIVFLLTAHRHTATPELKDADKHSEAAGRVDRQQTQSRRKWQQ